MENMHDILCELAQLDERSVLATIIQVDGSAYRKEGATMLFTESGKQTGVISAGCLEKDLSIQANQLLRDRTLYSKRIVYDMSSEDDMSWGRGAGCNGVVHVLLEKVTDELLGALLKLRTYLNNDVPVMSVRLLGDSVLSQPLFITQNKQMFGRRPFQHHQSIIDYVSQGDKSQSYYMEDLEQSVYVQYYYPKPRLYIFGAGPDVLPFASIAEKVGFSITIWDWRLSNLNKFKHINAQLMSNYSTTHIIKEIDFTPQDSVIIMTHDFQKDKELLHLLLAEKQLGYLGVLGPRQRTKRLLNDSQIPERIHSPVGLPIGGKGPNEIAISIIAELIHTQRQVMKNEWTFSNDKMNDGKFA